ncbi:MAG: DUF899 family protein [Planctomycetota bacterium]|jgi:predicted dithiol-disulfide oxidoreductase (DUF899 family)
MEARTPVEEKLQDVNKKIMELEKEAAALKQEWAAMDVQDYTLKNGDGDHSLSSLFGDNSTMVFVHNMGKSCPYCTIWADGLNGLWKYITEGVPGGESKNAFVVASPDTPDVQKEFADSRGWNFPMYSIDGTTLGKDLDMQDDEGHHWPGVSILQKDGDKITRVSRDWFGPGDKYCSVFSLLQIMPNSPTS